MSNVKLVFKIAEKLDVFILKGVPLKIRLRTRDLSHVDLPVKYWRVIVRNRELISAFGGNGPSGRHPLELDFVKKNFKGEFDVRVEDGGCIRIIRCTRLPDENASEIKIEPFIFLGMEQTAGGVEKEIRKTYVELRNERKAAKAEEEMKSILSEGYDKTMINHAWNNLYENLTQEGSHAVKGNAEQAKTMPEKMCTNADLSEFISNFNPDI